MAFETQRHPERAILVGLRSAPRRPAPAAEPRPAAPARDGDLEELAQLTEAAGGQVVGHVHQRRSGLHPATFLSAGKRNELAEQIEATEAEMVIVDEDLSPVQSRNLQRHLDCKVIDRTELILDIFSRRARTREAQLQVELAQLQYLLPRLTRMWIHLSRLGGGIGTRGPGETQLEVDRRRVRQRISILKRRLKAVEREREVQGRRRGDLFRAALVGYTNAGKSTLFNALTRAGVVEADQLFATLDTTTRRLVTPEGALLLLSDTVGFIRKLPHHLVASFRATLREVCEADLLVHVIDAAQPAFRRQAAAVDEVIEGLLDVRATPQLRVLNKIDRLDETARCGLRAEYPEGQLLSALDPRQVAALRERLLATAREIGLDPGRATVLRFPR